MRSDPTGQGCDELPLSIQRQMMLAMALPPNQSSSMRNSKPLILFNCLDKGFRGALEGIYAVIRIKNIPRSVSRDACYCPARD